MRRAVNNVSAMTELTWQRPGVASVPLEKITGNRCRKPRRALAYPLLFLFFTDGRKKMEPTPRADARVISLEEKNLRAAKCDKCGAKMYPQSLLEPHLSRHRRRQRWFNSEVRKLRYTFSHMRDIA
jgi:hypothetical protein